MQRNTLESHLESAGNPASNEVFSQTRVRGDNLGAISNSRDSATECFIPVAAKTLKLAGLSESEIEALILKYILCHGPKSGRQIANQLRLSYTIISEQLSLIKEQANLEYKAGGLAGDYEYRLTASGMERARALYEKCTYCGSAPVTLDDYANSVVRQSIKTQRPNLNRVIHAFDDLIMSHAMLGQIGQAINAGKSMFLFGAPGNGKTSIASRIVRSVDQVIWIPRTITVGGEIIRFFDPNCHQEIPLRGSDSMLSEMTIDSRWVRIQRPTVSVGGELNFEHLELTLNPESGINEAPVHFKSNCGCLVVDDFGRQRISEIELLNRWIIPLEKGHDFMNLPSGRQIRVPFDQLLVFATNLEPKELCDEAFLRRIPYKIEVFDPTVDQFRQLFEMRCERMGILHDAEVIDYTIEKHFRGAGRPLRFCYVDDLLLQVRDFCQLHEKPLELKRERMDIAVQNYFGRL